MDKLNKRRIRRGGAKRFMRPDKGFKFKAKNSSPSVSNLRAPNWNNMNLEPFQKNFYREHPNVMNRLRHDVERFRNKHEITVQGLALNPIESFDEVFMPDYVAREIRNQGYNRPTPIQSQTWPIAFSGYNLVGIAQTGSGKTLAYILPAIIHINNQSNIKPGDGPIAVVLAPTRELAVQIQQVAIDFGSSTHIRTVCTVGGVDKKPQEADLLKGCEIVVATPGRLLDFLSANVTNMRRCTYLVLDEADRMLDMGFEAQIRQIISQIRPDKQILMWSATWPLEIRRLAEDFLGHYIQVNIGSLELSANHNIKQFVHICQENEKSSKLQLLLRQIYQANNPGKILIFVAKKKRADMISKYINNFGVACESLHGDKPQSQRTKILDDFRSGRSNIIVATDVAARGLDVDGIMYVINLDFPKLIEDYVHRIGRCGRCDHMGISYAFFTANDAKQAKDLIAILNEANQPVDAKLQEIAFNPIKKPEKIDKKQRRLNENSGFDVPSAPEKRRHDGQSVNFSGPGPSSTITRDSYVGEPDIKRGRTDEPQPPGRGIMFNRNNDRDYMDKPSVNRGFMNIPTTVCNPGIQMDDRSSGIRPLDSRDNDRFQSNDRAMNARDFMTDRPAADDGRLVELRRREFERNVEPQFPNDFRLNEQASNRQRFQSTEFNRATEPAIGLDRMSRNDRVNLYDQRENEFGRQEIDFDRRDNDFGRRDNDFGRGGNDLGRRDNDFDRRGNDFGRRDNDFDRRGNDLGRRENDFGRRDNDFDRREIDFDRMNNFQDRLTDRISIDDIPGPVRDGRDIEVNRMRPMFDSSVSDHRNYERDLMDNRDAYPARAANFPDNQQNRTFDMLSERRSASQEFRRLSPMLDRSDVIADRFLDQSREDDAYGSLLRFGSRRDDFLEHTQDSGFDTSDRRTDFTDRDEPLTSNRWSNDIAGRNAHQQGQDRRNFRDDLRRQNEFDLGGEMSFNFARNNDNYDNDDFSNRNRNRNFERRNFDDRFNRFN